MKDNRLFRILYYILEKGKVTASELADQFEVSVRTIYRDIDSISSAGIPIYRKFNTPNVHKRPLGFIFLRK